MNRGEAQLDDQVLVCAGYQHTVRWRKGERLEQLFEDRCDELRAAGQGDKRAVDAAGITLTYDELDAHANRLARHLRALGVRPGDRIGLLFDSAVDSYAAVLAVLKVHAAYVPLDIGFPPDRVGYIVADAGVRMVLSPTHLLDRLDHLAVAVTCVDEVPDEEAGRLTDAEKGTAVDDLCYIVYTSGSTGRPKGVPISHAAICNFVRVAVEVYGIEPADRVYQGMTIAFDFSVEEIWVPLVAGATLVPKPGGSSLVGEELQEFLAATGVTALCCVPTLLATLDERACDLRFLLVSGEACPEDLVARWHRPGRRFLNVYGPTEATVTATWAEVHPDRPVTIGVPLPTYSVVILDPTADRTVPPGGLGEIGIAGIGLAAGYLNRDDLTERAFVPDFLGIENNPSGRIYRTGDLGRVNDEGEIEYHGRIDTQVKIRGYRIELTEIESVLLRVPGIAQAVVDTYEVRVGEVELVAYYSLRADTAAVDPERVYELLRGRLPAYMIPAYLEELEIIPMTANDKADRKSLPAPKGARVLLARQRDAAPATEIERQLAEVLASVMLVDRVSVESDVFEELGANSLLIARFCARLRDRPELPAVSMKDVYLHPTVRTLAAALSEVAPAAAEPPAHRVRPARTRSIAACGAAQLLFFLGLCLLDGFVLDLGVGWILRGTGVVDLYLRSAGFGAAVFVAASLLPILAKWTLVGRWRPREIPVWSAGYLRFWAVRTLVRFSPWTMFVGSPLYVLYLRALGARIGPGVAIFSRNVPLCTDLLTVGAGSVIRKDVSFSGYRVLAGRIQTGRITLGKDVFVGEATVLDIDTSMGDGAQLGHSSSLHPSQVVPDEQRWHGSPARAATVDYRRIGPVGCGRLRRVRYGVLQVLGVVLVYAPLGLAGVGEAVTLLNATPSGWLLYVDDLGAAFALYFGLLLAGLVLVLVVPRLLRRFVVPDRVYPLYGLRYSAHRMVARLSNARTFQLLFGDSSYITGYLSRLGYDLGRLEQTGSNFGLAVKHETPFLSSIGTGTMVSDGLSIINADFSSTSFRVTPVSIGPRTFLGNNIAYPAGGRTGENCLLATKVMVPLDGPIRANTGLLGSPCFDIPRSVQRDGAFDHLRCGARLSRGLAAKKRHNTVTIGLYLLTQGLLIFSMILLAELADRLHSRLGAVDVAADIVVTIVFSIGYLTLIERAVQAFRPLRPRFCSIYDRTFWRHERFWKMSAGRYLTLFNGTPFKGTMWRLLGVRVGRGLFDDGCGIPEKSLVTIGDDCTLNAASVLQGHSLEDGTFKSDRIVIGDGCTVGPNAFVHYGVTMGDGAVAETDSFVMKGSELTPRARWRGNPATELR